MSAFLAQPPTLLPIHAIDQTLLNDAEDNANHQVLILLPAWTSNEYLLS
jgi:hypothetical protein